MYCKTLPFQRGTTWNGSGTPSAADGVQHEGQEFEIEDSQYSTGRTVVLRCVRNISGHALSAKLLVKLNADGKNADTYTVTTAARGKPVDDAYGSNTIADDDLFYVVMKGPCLIKTSTLADAGNVITANEAVYAVTAATSGVAGRIEMAHITGLTGSAALNAVLNSVGRAITARTTGNTDTDTLVMVGEW